MLVFVFVPLRPEACFTAPSFIPPIKLPFRDLSNGGVTAPWFYPRLEFLGWDALSCGPPPPNPEGRRKLSGRAMLGIEAGATE